RGGAGRRALRPAAPSLHQGAAVVRPAPRVVAAGRQPRAARRDSRHGAEAVGGHPRLRLRAALRPCDRALHARAAAARQQGAGPHRRLLRGRPGGGVVSLAQATTTAAKANGALLTVEGLKKHYPVRRGLFSTLVGLVYAVDGISFSIAPGETLGLVGESGCG